MLINKKDKIIVIFVLLFLVGSIVIQPASSLKITKNDDCDTCNCSDCIGYIIQLRDKPLLEFVNNLKNKLSSSFISLKNCKNIFSSSEFISYKEKIESLHLKAKEDIKNILNTEENIISNEFSILFNGFSIKKVSDGIVEKIANLPYVEKIFKDSILEQNLADSVPLIEADKVWELQDSYVRNVTGEGVTVALLDTGVDYTHPDLGGGFGPSYKIVDGYDFVTCEHFDSDGDCISPRLPDDDPMDDAGHGTHCAGIVFGVAPNVTMYAYKVLNGDGEGYSSWVQAALEKCMDPNDDGDYSDHIDIVSMSLGSEKPGNPDGNFSLFIDDVVRNGIVVVASAGNIGTGGIVAPACSRKAISVGASTKTDGLPGSSSRGPTINGILKPDVLAPGVSISSTALGGGYTTLSGTSMACPHVSGAAALILQKHPEWNPDEVKMAIRITAVDIGYKLNEQGFGRINAFNAVNLSEAPPVALLNTSGNVTDGDVAINGIVSAENFEGFTLEFIGVDTPETGVIVDNGTYEVFNDQIAVWDASSLIIGKTYMLKLEVFGNNQSVEDFSYVKIVPSKSLYIEAPSNVSENSEFTVKVFDKDYEPTRSFVIFTVPFHMPRISYGLEHNFTAPNIRNNLFDSMNGKLIVIKFIGMKIERETIEILNII